MHASATLAIARDSRPLELSPADRGFRGGYRIETGAVDLVLGDRALVAEVTEVSAEHVVVAWPAGRMIEPRASMAAKLRVAGFADLSLAVRIGPANLRDRVGVVGFTFVDPTRQDGAAVLERVSALVQRGDATAVFQTPGRSETITEPSLVTLTLSALLRNGGHALMRHPGGTSTVLPERGPEGLLAWRVRGRDVPAGGEVTVELAGYNSVYAIQVTLVGSEDGVLLTTAPDRLERVRHRTRRRAAAPEGMVLSFEHPVWGDLTVSGNVRDLSSDGLAFGARPVKDLLYPGLWVPGATIRHGGRLLQATLEVRWTGESGGLGTCGVKLLPEGGEDERTWLALADEQLHPTTRSGTSYVRATWELFERAGYFSLSGKSSSDFDAMARDYGAVAERLEQAPHLACQIVRPSGSRPEDGVEAAMSMAKVYSGAWFVYHLAKVSGPARDGTPSRNVLRDLVLHCYEHAGQDADLRWLVAIMQVKNTWSRLVHYDMPERHVTSGKAAIVRFRVAEVNCSAPLIPADSSRGVTIGGASREELRQVLTQIQKTRPAAYVQTLDLVEERFDLADLCDDWSLADLSRRRTLLVARENGIAVAAAILESADEGLHLFRLLDSVRLFTLEEGGDRWYAAMLEAAGAWYRAMGKNAFLAFLEDGREPPSEIRHASTDLGMADLVTLSADLLPEFLEHVVCVTAPREALD